jgi:hypothetical protein
MPNFNFTDFSPFYMGFAAVNRSDKSYEIHVINNGENNITLVDWTSSNTDFSVQTYQNNNSEDFFPNTIESNSSSWINNVKQMWVRFNPTQAGESESMLTLNVIEENARGYSIDFNLNATGYLIP